MKAQGLSSHTERLFVLFLVIPFVCALSLINVQNTCAGETSVVNSSSDNYERNLKRWQSLSENDRQTLRERAKKISPEQLTMLKQEAAKFQKLPQEEQERIRNNYKKFNQMPPQARETIQTRQRQFERLPPERKEALRRQFRGKQAPARGERPLRKSPESPHGKTDPQSDLHGSKPAKQNLVRAAGGIHQNNRKVNDEYPEVKSNRLESGQTRPENPARGLRGPAPQEKPKGVGPGDAQRPPRPESVNLRGTPKNQQIRPNHMGHHRPNQGIGGADKGPRTRPSGGLRRGGKAGRRK